jgi:hypothetical protein
MQLKNAETIVKISLDIRILEYKTHFWNTEKS